MGQLQIAVIAGTADEIVVHEFDRRRIKAGLNEFRDQGRRLSKVGKDGQDVEFVWRQWNEFQRRLSNDAQRPFGPDDELIQTEAGRTFLKRRAEIYDLPRRQNGFDGIDLVAGRTVTNGFIAAGIGGQVTADETAVRATGVTGVEQAFFASCILNVNGPYAGFNDHIHAVFVQLEDFIHPFHEEDDAFIGRNGTAADAGTGTARRDRDAKVIGDFKDLRNFFSTCRQDDDFRRPPKGRR